MDDGRVIGGRYRLGTKLGAGGMGTVWRAYDMTLHREVAIKEIRVPSSLRDEVRSDLNRRALLEARSAARLNHPNIVSVHDVLVEDEQTWIVMMLVHGRSMHDAVLDQGRFDPLQAAQVGLGLLSALDAAHASGILHRDVKPSNVMLPAAGGVLLTDFSIAALVDAATATGNSLLLGTPGYVAPERVTSGRAGPPADLFGLGATLYFATEARGPFDRPDPLAQLFATANHAPEPPQYAGPLVDVIAGLLIKDPDQRWTSTRCRSALEAIIARPAAPPTGDPVTVWLAAVAAATTDGGPARTKAAPPAIAAPPIVASDATTVTVATDLEPDRRRRRLLVALIGLVLLAMIAGGGAYWFGREPSTGQPAAGDHPTVDQRLGRGETPSTSDSPTPSPSPTASAPAPTGGTGSGGTGPVAAPPPAGPAIVGTASYGTAGYGLGFRTLPWWNAGDSRWHLFDGGVTHSNQPDQRAIVHDTATSASLGQSSTGHNDVAQVAQPGIQEVVALIAANGTYYLYYFEFPDLTTTQGPLYAATSTDLENWQLRGVVISDQLQLRGGLDVVSYGGQYLAFAATASGTTVRTSSNLLSWSAPTSTGLPVTRVCGVFSYGGKYYLAGVVNGNVDLIRAANPTSFGSGEHLRVPPPAVDPAWQGPLNHIVIGPGNQPVGFGESGWWAPLSWSV